LNLFQVTIAPGATLNWRAVPGEAFIDIRNGVAMGVYGLRAYNTSNSPTTYTVTRRDDFSLEFTPGLLPSYELLPLYKVIEPKTVLPDPDFSLEELERAQEVLNNLP